MSQTHIDKDQTEQVQPVQQQNFTRVLQGPSQVLYSQPQVVYQPATQLVYQSQVGEGQAQQVVQAPTTQFVGTSQVIGSSRLHESIKGESRIEYVPYEKSVIEYEAVQRTEYVPKEKKITDYYAVEYVTEYIPQVYQDKYIEYIPQERVAERVEYQAVERQVVHPPVQEQVQQTVQYVPAQTQYVVQQPVLSYVQPQQVQQVEVREEKQKESKPESVQSAQFVQQPVILSSSRVVQQPVYYSVVPQWPAEGQQVSQNVVYQPYVQPTTTSQIRYLPQQFGAQTVHQPHHGHTHAPHQTHHGHKQHQQQQQQQQQQQPKRKESRSFLDKLFD